MGKRRGKKNFPPAAGAQAGSWASLQPPLSPGVLRAVKNSFGFTRMTPVQSTTIPLLMSHKDVSVQAVTGSGKTLAFVIPIVEMLLSRKPALRRDEVGAVIVAPSRELARQISAVTSQLLTGMQSVNSNEGEGNNESGNNDSDQEGDAEAAPTPLCVLSLVGGTELVADLAKFRKHGGSILVGTPGRLRSFMDAVPARLLRSVEVCVLDEADRLLQLGFADTLSQILAHLPKQRRTGLFSATQTQEVEDLARAGLRNPVRVAIEVRERLADPANSSPATDSAGQATGPSPTALSAVRATPRSLANFYCLVPRRDKLSTLVRFLARHPHAKVIVYTMTCACVDYLWKALDSIWPRPSPASQTNRQRDTAVSGKVRPVARQLLSLHGKVPQAKRLTVYDQFCETDSAILLCTDVAARGLDIPDVDWIVQLDAPQQPDAFVHRVGRTARMGRRGSALLLLTPAEDAFVEFLRNRRIPLQSIELDEQEGGSTDLADGKDRREGARAGAQSLAQSSGTAERSKSSMCGPTARESVSRVSLSRLQCMETDALTAVLRQLALRDREVMKRAQKAFVSYIRAYKEHRLSYLFPFSKLEFGHLAHSFGLLRLPAMPELRGAQASKRSEGFVPVVATFSDDSAPSLDSAPGTAAELSSGAVSAPSESGQHSPSPCSGGKSTESTERVPTEPLNASDQPISLAAIPFRDVRKEKQRQEALARRQIKQDDPADGEAAGGGTAGGERTVPPAVARQQAMDLKRQRRKERVAKRQAKVAKQTSSLIQSVLHDVGPPVADMKLDSDRVDESNRNSPESKTSSSQSVDLNVSNSKKRKSDGPSSSGKSSKRKKKKVAVHRPIR